MEIDGIPARIRVTHPSINRDRRRVTSFMRRTTLATVLRADAAPGSRRYRSISPAGRAHSSKPAAATDNMEQQHTATVLRPLRRSTGVSQQLQLETGGFVGAQFFCPCALAGGNQRIRVRVPRRVRENVGEGEFYRAWRLVTALEVHIIISPTPQKAVVSSWYKYRQDAVAEAQGSPTHHVSSLSCVSVYVFE